MIFAILLGLIFVFIIGIMALGIVYYARDHCDETLPDPPNPPDQPD